MGWMTKTFDQINLHVYKDVCEYPDISHDMQVYDNYYNWPTTQKLTPSNIGAFIANTNAYLNEKHDKDLMHQLYSILPNGGLMQLKNDDNDVVAELEYRTSVGLHLCYVTYQWNTGWGELVSCSDTGYPAYQGGYDAGMKFRAIISGNNGNNISSTSSMLYIRRINNGTTVKSMQTSVICSALAIDDLQILMEGVTEIKVPPIPGCGTSGNPSPSGNVMAFNLVPGVILIEKEWVQDGDRKSMLTFNLHMGYENITDKYPTLADTTGWSNWIDISDVTETPTEEDGYMNDLENRFSPRYSSNGVGMYLVPVSHSESDPTRLGDIQDIMSMLQEYDISNELITSWIGTDGKEYLLNIRWYYGLNKPQAWKSLVVNEGTQQPEKHKLQIGPVCPVEGVPPAAVYYYNYIFASEFAKFTTPTLQVPAHFNNYLDFACNYKLYLPYYGFLDIDPNDIVGGTVQVIYNINLFSGATNIHVICKNSRLGNKDTKCYSVDCTVGEDIPFTSDMYKSFGLVAAEKGAWAAKTLIGAHTGQIGAAANTAMNQINASARESIIRAGKDITADQKADIYNKQNNDLNNIRNSVSRANSVNEVVQSTMQFNVNTPSRSGGLTDETGCMDELFPYLLITRPVTAEPASYENYVGMPSTEAVTLNTCSGFTQIAAISPESISLNVNVPRENEMNEIISLLQAGVYL